MNITITRSAVMLHQRGGLTFSAPKTLFSIAVAKQTVQWTIYFCLDVVVMENAKRMQQIFALFQMCVVRIIHQSDYS